MKNLILTNIIVAICVVGFIVISNILSYYGLAKCLTVKYFHMYCPGCGGTRALSALLRLDFLSMLKYNPILPMAIIVYLYYNIRAFIEIKRNNETYFQKNRFKLITVVIAIGFIYFMARNILLLYGIDLIGDIIQK